MYKTLGLLLSLFLTICYACESVTYESLANTVVYGGTTGNAANLADCAKECKNDGGCLAAQYSSEYGCEKFAMHDSSGSETESGTTYVYNIQCASGGPPPPSSSPCDPANVKFTEGGQYFTYEIYNTAEIGDKKTCAARCFTEQPKCKSAVFTTYGCELSELTRANNGDDYQADSGSIYMHSITCAAPAPAPGPAPSPAPPPSDDQFRCGENADASTSNSKLANSNQVTTRIVGGEAAKLNAWPWQVTLQLQTRASGSTPFYSAHNCGGSLVRVSTTHEETDIVVTAAHCLKPYGTNYASNKIRAGEHNLVNTETSEQSADVKIWYNHEAYNSVSSLNDIAVIVLKNPFKMGNGTLIGPVCLPKTNEKVSDGKNCIATGWGSIGNNVYPKTLQEVVVPIVAHSKCNADDWYNGKIDQNSMLCAGFEQGTKDSCSGDSGGPLVCNIGTSDRYMLHGATSFGIGCAVPKKPGVYARLSNYCEWIHDKICKHSAVPGHDAPRFCDPNVRCK